MGRWRKIGPAEEREIWDRIEAGENLSSVGRALGRHSSAIHMLLEERRGEAQDGRTSFSALVNPRRARGDLARAFGERVAALYRSSARPCSLDDFT